MERHHRQTDSLLRNFLCTNYTYAHTVNSIGYVYSEQVGSRYTDGCEYYLYICILEYVWLYGVYINDVNTTANEINKKKSSMNHLA